MAKETLLAYRVVGDAHVIGDLQFAQQRVGDRVCSEEECVRQHLNTGQKRDLCVKQKRPTDMEKRPEWFLVLGLWFRVHLRDIGFGS